MMRAQTMRTHRPCEVLNVSLMNYYWWLWPMRGHMFGRSFASSTDGAVDHACNHQNKIVLDNFWCDYRLSILSSQAHTHTAHDRNEHILRRTIGKSPILEETYRQEKQKKSKRASGRWIWARDVARENSAKRRCSVIAGKKPRSENWESNQMMAKEKALQPEGI